ncbi:MAG: TlpA disulfide reductase family protein [Xanthomonadales bacterium]|nr:TlpA disulfide reductase family protein [Xanthomonadales bacterium]
MNRTTLLILVAAFVSGLLGFMLSQKLAEPTADDGPVGQPLPQFDFPDLAGARWRPDNFAGRALVVNFWATWCKPCRKEMPILEDLAQRYGVQGLSVVGIAMDDAAQVASFLQEVPVSYPILIPDTLSGIQFARAAGNPNGVLPYTLLVDPDGQVQQVKLGEINQQEADRMARELLVLD